MNKETIKILERTLIFGFLTIIGSLLLPIIYKHYLKNPIEITTIDQDWTITLTSPNGDEYETWYYHGPKPTQVYQTNCSYLSTNNYGHPLTTDTGEPRAPIGWYLYITNGKENTNLKITKQP